MASVTFLRWMGVVMCLVQIVFAAGLPAFAYALVFKGNERLSIDTWMHWGISVGAGIVGMIALISSAPWLLTLHTVLAAMLGAALAAHNTVTYAMLELQCKLTQMAWSSCSSCMCAATSSCSQANFDTTAGCKACDAPSSDLCQDFHKYKIEIAVIAVATVLLMSVPPMFSLLSLLRVEAAHSSEAAKLEWVRGRLREQLALLEAGQPLTFPFESLLGGMQKLMATRNKDDLELKRKVTVALLAAGYELPENILSPRKGQDSTIPITADATIVDMVVPATAWAGQNDVEAGTVMEGSPPRINQVMPENVTSQSPLLALPPGQPPIVPPELYNTPVPELTVSKSKKKKDIVLDGDVDEVATEEGGDAAGDKKKKKKKKSKKKEDEEGADEGAEA